MQFFDGFLLIHTYQACRAALSPIDRRAGSALTYDFQTCISLFGARGQKLSYISLYRSISLIDTIVDSSIHAKLVQLPCLNESHRERIERLYGKVRRPGTRGVVAACVR
jgi:hypothetical protein